MSAPTGTDVYGYPRLRELSERCDRCPAPGQVRVVLRSGLDLVFCNHHAHAFAAALREQCVRVSEPVSGGGIRW